MKILISGSTGLVGSALMNSLKGDGHDVFALVRRAPDDDTEVEWYPERGSLALARLEGMDAVVHLAGESIAEGRWTNERKRSIRESRVKGTTVLSEALANLKHPPQTLLCASAIGYYGDRGDEILTEESVPGNDFLAKVCIEWERATRTAAEKGIRVVNLRFGIILSAEGGALAKMLPPFRMGAGGRIGSGKQWMSWIALDDVVGVIKFALASDAEALDACSVLSRKEGLIPALESAHAVAELLGNPRRYRDKLVIVNLSGRGDKDMPTLQREIE